MDLDEWEFLPEDGFIDFHHHEDDKKGLIDSGFDRKDVFDMNYFILPSTNSRRLIEKPKNSSVIKKGMNQVVPVSIQLEPKEEKKPEQELVQEIIKLPIVEIKAPNLVLVGEDQDTVSQVFFKKMKENEFVDMKLDSPKSGSRGIKAQTETGSIQFEDKGEVYDKNDQVMENKKTSSKTETDQEMKNFLDSNIKEERKFEESGGGLNIWRWRLTGIGALCSIGLTAATICIFILGSRQQQKYNKQNQKIRIQIYAEDKRIKQVVHHATKLNHAISAVRGVPLTRAHITFGGYYDGL
ncbi:hypothetical protein BVC80_8885g21 [Macleaya cordata]|uniref:DUF6821 domain-containing protein n=1 Tax=Macleaya cordata TaxID=56857 RepID=A0A200Q7A5_MACCD|nr:hypothetical protein BVC80_8885g21 [Macleaya cordata]